MNSSQEPAETNREDWPGKQGPAPGPQRRSPLPVVTYVTLAICGAVYWVSSHLTGYRPTGQALIRYGAKVNHLIEQGQSWRLLSCMFLHGFTWHLGLNCLFLFSLGRGLETTLGSRRILCLFVVSGAAGSYASFLHSPNLSVGASGGLFGLFGAALVLYLKIILRLRARGVKVPRSLLSSFIINLFILGLNVFIGLVLPFVDNSAHMGGLLTGGLLCTFFPLEGLHGQDSRPRPWLTMASLACVCVLAWAGVCATRYALTVTAGELARAEATVSRAIQTRRHYRAGPSGGNILPRWFPGAASERFSRGVAFHEKGNLDEAAKAYREAIEADPKMFQPYFNLGLIEMKRGHYDKATELFQTVVELKPEMAAAHINLGAIHSFRGELELSLASFKEAVRAEPENAIARRELGRTYAEVRMFPEAIKHLGKAQELDAKDAQTCMLLGKIYVQTGDEERARAQLSRLRILDNEKAPALEAAIVTRFGRR